MARLLVHGETLDTMRSSVQAALGLTIHAAEAYGDALFLAVESGGQVTALIGEKYPLRWPLPSGETHVLTLDGEEGQPAPHQVSEAFTRGLSHRQNAWRERTAQWQARTARTSSGEELLGEYPSARDATFSFDPQRKEAFKADALRYLKRLQHHLQLSGKVSFNPGGPGVAGDALLEASTPAGPLRVHVGGSGSSLRGYRASPGGAYLWWCLNEGRNHGAHWDAPARELASVIQAELHAIRTA